MDPKSRILRPPIRSRASGRQLSKVSEKRGARYLRGRVQPASGALPVAGLKADISTEEFLIEDKITERASFSVTAKIWRKIWKAAMKVSKRPAMRVTLKEQGITVYVLSEHDFEELCSNSQAD